MIRVIHISDTHFSHDPKKNTDQLRLTDKIYKAGFGENDYLLVTGDVVDDGEKGQYKEAMAAMGAFAPRILAAPGNHDYGPLGNVYSESSARWFDTGFCKQMGIPTGFFRKKEPVVTGLDDGDGSRLLAIGLNSCAKTSDITDFAGGEIGFEQLKALDMLLDDPAFDGIPKLVYLHHRPQPLSIFMALNDYEDLMAVLHNRADLLCFGHSGGDLEKEEPTAARVMVVRERPFGVRWMLNANSSVRARKYFLITVDKGKLSVTMK